MNLFIALSMALAAMICAAMLVMSARALLRSVPLEDRAFLDPLPGPIAAVWPLVRVIERHTARWFPKTLLRDTRSRLEAARATFVMTEVQFIALRLSGALLGVAAAAFIGFALGRFSLIACIGASIAGLVWPRVWLRDMARRQERLIVRQLPVYLSLLTMAVEAGANLTGALETAVRKGPSGPLQREFEHVLRDMRSGLSRAEALHRMAQRTRLRELAKFSSAVTQAERMGSGLANTLRFQSRQQLAQRFQRAEQQAMEAPVKLIFPLVLFIFPVTFIVLAFPVAMKFISEGML
jgi:tight adherence protein C